MMPAHVDTLILGGGTAGCALAGLIAERSSDTILLLEAGPDYGSLHEGHWPRELLDARRIPVSHDWGYDSGPFLPGRRVAYERARVIGGCSAHNGCSAVWGTHWDYDGWAAAGNAGWSAGEVLPLLQAVDRRLKVRRYEAEEIPPYQRAVHDAARAAGFAASADMNDMAEDEAVAYCPVNNQRGIRWNTAFAYLDPVRNRRGLTIRGSALINRLLLERGRVAGAEAIIDGTLHEVRARRTVLAAGAYGSPAILLRSGIGDPRLIEPHGLRVAHALPGVGRNLQDHPAVAVAFPGSRELEAASAAFERSHWTPEELVIVKARSRQARESFDLHLFSEGGRVADGSDAWRWQIYAAGLLPRSRGQLRLASVDPAAAPLIEHRHLSDAEGHDLAVLADGVELIRQLASQTPLARWLGAPFDAAILGDRRAREGWIRARVVHYWHPAGSCAMGSDPAAGAVVDARGKIHGLEDGYVADASIMPALPRANTNIPTVLVAERIASWLT
ncbi:putative glucose-methanol-choline oxidoreductase [Hypericibacter adhaerens]|uniref:Putative glucose-methanol-choline oxidoreductase n=1 Tax=Hypericibacter adhaerens TaxID=2602016 RepID=A0A5J6N5P6_9PROT|nr:GMC family oxidoreductase [Hypericibacter adhaerens]QEX24737.1 putative glucose-methanol-choline oxidoreductase [Hypericibacter adhaerens]